MALFLLAREIILGGFARWERRLWELGSPGMDYGGIARQLETGTRLWTTRLKTN